MEQIELLCRDRYFLIREYPMPPIAAIKRRYPPDKRPARAIRVRPDSVPDSFPQKGRVCDGCSIRTLDYNRHSLVKTSFRSRETKIL